MTVTIASRNAKPIDDLIDEFLGIPSTTFRASLATKYGLISDFDSMNAVVGKRDRHIMSCLVVVERGIKNQRTCQICSLLTQFAFLRFFASLLTLAKIKQGGVTKLLFTTFVIGNAFSTTISTCCVSSNFARASSIALDFMK